MDEKTICDRCGKEIKTEEANDVENGEWAGAVLCNDCYTLVVFDEDEEKNKKMDKSKKAIEVFEEGYKWPSRWISKPFNVLKHYIKDSCPEMTYGEFLEEIEKPYSESVFKNVSGLAEIGYRNIQVYFSEE